MPSMDRIRFPSQSLVMPLCGGLFTLFCAVQAPGQTLKPLGPPGGDVRTLATAPGNSSRVFLGTADGHIFGSDDSGSHWKLLGRASSRLDAVITAIVVDPRNGDVLYASSWARDTATGGGVFRSRDGGRTWSPAGLQGQAVRALALAPSDPNVLVAGTLDGIYRSPDASKTWERISPEHHQELRYLDSLAIDPHDPQTIYAGTFHLPWKTTDGGRTWRPVHDGMIDDSDVMSLLIDGQSSERIYASACSGIYRSEDGASQWRKIQGIPYTARRTYAIAQDPRRPGNVYAATSEGLWKTPDGGMTWRLATPDSWVVNAVVVSEGGRVVIGTEELGVLSSDDEGAHFRDANAGFEHRQILALGLDAKKPGRIVAVLAHAPDSVVTTDDEGRTWSALGPSLQAGEPLRIYAAPDGAWWVSSARGGLLRYDDARRVWKRTGSVLGEAEDGTPLASGERRKSAGRSGSVSRPLLDLVTDLAFSSKQWYAATSRGLLASEDRGVTWKRKPVGPLDSLPVQSVRASWDGRRIRVVSLRGLVFSEDGGTSWTWHDLPLSSGGAVQLDSPPDDDKTLVATARNGLYISRDAGKTWQQAGSGLPTTPVQGFAASGGLFVAAMQTGGLYFSSDSGRTWDRVAGTLADGTFAAVAPANEPGMIFAASATDGLYEVEWPGRETSQSETLAAPHK